jgi:hypothetical protein
MEDDQSCQRLGLVTRQEDLGEACPDERTPGAGLVGERTDDEFVPGAGSAAHLVEERRIFYTPHVDLHPLLFAKRKLYHHFDFTAESSSSSDCRRSTRRVSAN